MQTNERRTADKRGNPMKKNKCRLILSVVALLLLSLLCLPACTTSPGTETTAPPITTPSIEWDPIFVNEFNPDPNIMSKLSGSVQDINLKSSVNGITVHIKQTLGDAKTLYIALDILFPDDVDVGLISNDNKQDGVTVSTLPETLRLFEGKIAYDDTDARPSHKKIPDTGSTKIETRGIDLKNNSVSFLLSFNSNYKCFDVEEVTLLVGNFNLKQDSAEVKTYPDLHTISWRVENKTPIIEKKIRDGDQIVGTFLLSPFSFTGTLYLSDYKIANAFHHSIRFVLKDGRIFQPETALTGKSGGFSPSTGNATRSYLFTQPIDIDNIKEVHIGGFRIKI
ncbi:MAG: DUF4179 domain-containing protein [Eubacteriales bacterium]|nr:DUF4179 domain-containing protein [Eubacteriales bacterium]